MHKHQSSQPDTHHSLMHAHISAAAAGRQNVNMIIHHVIYGLIQILITFVIIHAVIQFLIDCAQTEKDTSKRSEKAALCCFLNF